MAALSGGSGKKGRSLYDCDVQVEGESRAKTFFAKPNTDSPVLEAGAKILTKQARNAHDASDDTISG